VPFPVVVSNPKLPPITPMLLYRLSAADYSTGDYYHYAYDGVGNRIYQESMVSGQSSVSSYHYDHANRLVDVNGIPYSWDTSGNLLSAGMNTYTYESANHLSSIMNQFATSIELATSFILLSVLR